MSPTQKPRLQAEQLEAQHSKERPLLDVEAASEHVDHEPLGYERTRAFMLMILHEVNDTADENHRWGSLEDWCPIDRASKTPLQVMALEVQRAITHGAFELSREYLFMEGSYELPRQAVDGLLELLGLLDVVSHARPAPGDIEKDKDAATIIQRLTHARFQDKWDFAATSSAFDMMKKIEAGCRPFRLMDLPRELRDNIYEHMESQLISTESRYHLQRCDGRPRDSDWYFDQRVCDTPMHCMSSDQKTPWLGHVTVVCQEFRDALTVMYVARNSFELPGEAIPCDSLRVSKIEKLSKDIGMRRLKYIRSMKVTMLCRYKKGMQHAEFYDFKITFKPSKGLRCWYRLENRLEDDETSFWRARSRTTKPSKYLELVELGRAMEKRKTDKQWDGTGVMNCFLEEWPTLGRVVESKGRLSATLG